MKKENMVGFRVSMYDCTSPQEFAKQTKPNNCIDSAWIPQTMGDQVWIWYEFKNTKERAAYLLKMVDFSFEYLSKWSEAKDGNTTHHEETKTMHPARHYMHDDEFMTQEEITHWTGGATVRKRKPETDTNSRLLFDKTMKLLHEKRTVWNRVKLYLCKRKITRMMKNHAVWSKFDILRFHDVEDEEFARINWADPTEVTNLN